MFKKPPNVKNISALRSSDRKKIIQQIVQSYSLDHLDPAAKNALLPDGAQVRFCCVSDQLFRSACEDLLLMYLLSLPSLQHT